MTARFSTALRTARATAIVTEAGASAKLKYYNGAQPTTGAAVTSQTLLATLIGGSVLGTVSAGVLTLGAVTQTNSAHVAGTPTWLRLTKSDDTFVADFAVAASAGAGVDIVFTGAIATGTNVTQNATTITEGNP